jgi:hypothetical protein
MDDDILRYLVSLDKRHQREGNYAEWMLSQERADIAGPRNHVRIVTWRNLRDLCKAASLDETKLIAAYRESLNTDDVLFVEWEEVASESTSDRNGLESSSRDG